MRGLLRRAAVVAGAAVVLLGPAAGMAGAAAGPVLNWSPTTSSGTYNYGTVAVGQTVSQVFTLKNSGSRATGALTVSLAGSAAFSKTKDVCTGVKLGPGTSCSVTVAYAPATPSQADSVTLTATSSKPAATASLTLKGAGGKASPALATSPSAGGTVGSTTVTDTAKLSGGFSPGGTIEFTLYGPSTTAACSGTPVDDETVPVSGDGSYTTPAGATPSQGGTYWWTASYSGDANNTADTKCGDESVTISKASPALATAPSAGGTVGAAVSDAAALAGGDNPTGTIEFKLFGPSTTAACSTTPVFDQTVGVSGDGGYTSPSFTPSQPGTYWWTARYSGDPNNNTVASGCDQESVTVSKASPGIATALSATGTGTVGGTTVTDAAALSGGSSPGGTIEFTLYGPSTTATCTGTPVFDQAVTVSGDGTYTSPSFTPTQAGTYWWVASYSGDANNNTAATKCGDESVTISKVSPAITTSPSPGGPVGSTTVSDTATLTGSYNATRTIEFTVYGPSTTATCTGTPVFDQTVSVSGDGTYTSPSFTPTQAGTYWWVASYSGDPNNNTAATNCGDEPVTITSSAHLYWTDLGGGTITGGTVKEANLDGSNQQTIADNQADPEGVAVSSSNLYWAVAGLTTGSGQIWEANLDGTNAHALTIPPQDNPKGVAVNGSNLYWADNGDGTIWEANLDGTNAHPLTSIPPQAGPAGVAVNGSNLYWADNGNGQIWEANLDGINAHSLTPSPIPGQPEPVGVAVNGSNLYWADNGGLIWEANLDGTNAHPLTIPAQPGPVGVAASNSNIYWADGGSGQIWEANLDGTSLHALAILPQSGLGYVAVGPQ